MLLVLSIYTLLTVVNSLSACDDIDIIFLLDQDSITHNFENVLAFIESIIHDGSSEYSAFSAYIYGNEVNDLEINLLDTFDTFRSNKSDIIATQLKQTFQQIVASQKNNNGLATRKISLIEAFNVASQQQQPFRTHKKRNKFNTAKYKKHNIGGADDDNKYFIFDYYNTLLSSIDESDDVCKLYKYITDKQDESIHFIFGHESNNFDYFENGFCDGAYDAYIHEDSFFYLISDDISDYSDDINNDYGFLYNLFTGAETMESIYHITCPAHHDHPSGFIHLTAHNQFIDRDTFIKCNLKYDNNNKNENAIGPKLNQHKSYILVDDHLYDDNTFKLNDYLIADLKTFEQIKHIGCNEPIYKIIDIKHVKTVTDSHKMLKLYVQLPESPMDFILSIDVTGHKHPAQNVHKNINIIETKTTELGNINTTDIDELGNRRKLPGLWGKHKYEELVDASSDAQEKQFINDKDIDGKSKTLIDKTWPLNYNKDWVKDIDIQLVPGFQLVGSGKGSVNFGLDLVVKTTFDYKLHWSKILTGKKVKSAIKFAVNGMWSLKGNVKFTIDAQLSLKGTLIPKIGQTIIVPIGVVPFVFKPYFKTEMKIDLTSFYFEFTLDCDYSETISIAYDYKGTRASKKSLFNEDEPPTAGIVARSKAALQKAFTISHLLKSKARAPKFTRTKTTYHLLEDESDVPIVAPQEDSATVDTPPSGPWSFTRVQTKNECTTKLILTNQKDNTCDVKIGMEIYIMPRIGVAIYGAVSIQGGFNIKVPVKYGVTIESDGICPNKKNKVCPPEGQSIGAEQAIQAVPQVSISIQASIDFKIAIPNLLRGIKEFFVLRKIYKGMKDDIDALATMTEQSAKELKKLYDEFEDAWDKNNGIGFTKARDIFAVLLPKIEQWYNKYKTEKGKIEVIINKCKKRIDKITEMVKRVKDIINNPFSMKNFLHNVKYPKEYKQVWAWTPQKDHCSAIPKDSVVAQVFTDKNKNGCCKGFTYTAKQDIFSDWYHGYDAYAYDEYNKKITFNPYPHKKHVNYAPIVHSAQSYNPLNIAFMLDIFTIFIIMICISGCICLACGAFGAFVFYKYDKLQQKQTEYNQINQNDEQI
eukprot:300100_1